MFELLKVRKGTKESEPMTLQLAYATSRLAFDFLTGQEVRGLVWTASPLDPNVGSVHYDLDPSYPHECVAIKISNEMTKQLQAFGESCTSCHLLLQAHADQLLHCDKSHAVAVA